MTYSSVEAVNWLISTSERFCSDVFPVSRSSSPSVTRWTARIKKSKTPFFTCASPSNGGILSWKSVLQRPVNKTSSQPNGKKPYMVPIFINSATYRKITQSVRIRATFSRLAAVSPPSPAAVSTKSVNHFTQAAGTLSRPG